MTTGGQFYFNRGDHRQATIHFPLFFPPPCSSSFTPFRFSLSFFPLFASCFFSRPLGPDHSLRTVNNARYIMLDSHWTDCLQAIREPNYSIVFISELANNLLVDRKQLRPSRCPLMFANQFIAAGNTIHELCLQTAMWIQHLSVIYLRSASELYNSVLCVIFAPRIRFNNRAGFSLLTTRKDHEIRTLNESRSLATAAKLHRHFFLCYGALAMGFVVTGSVAQSTSLCYCGENCQRKMIVGGATLVFLFWFINGSLFLMLRCDFYFYQNNKNVFKKCYRVTNVV